MTEPVIEAADIVKILGDGAGQVRRSSASATLAGGQLTADGAVRRQQDHAVIDSRMHAVADQRNGARGRQVTEAGPEDRSQLRREHVGFIFQSLSSVSDLDRDRQRSFG
jgi:hypothetical protein